MPVIDGYNEQTTGGFAEFPVGKHDVTIETAEFKSDTDKNGNAWSALIVGIAGEGPVAGISTKEFIKIPEDTADWQSWKNGARSATKGNLDALGIDMSVVESDDARGELIGKPAKIEVKKNGEYKNTYFQTDAAPVAGLPGPELISASVTNAPVALVV